MWWLIHPTTKQAIAAFEDPRTGAMRELTLPQCIDVWGAALSADATATATASDDAYQDVEVKNHVLRIPRVPKKFLKFAFTRRSIHREVSNMSGLDFHANVLRLDAALELVQDSKCTTFLVLELAAGGELFDRIKLDCGTDEATARRYLSQLLSGVAFCHASGVCHRDLKPENLLLADTEEHSTLKIADFGLSAIFAITDSSESGDAAAGALPCIRRLRSVVGSPHYVAPEVLLDAGQGYDGAKADAWSIGVILYAMIAGNLPFGKDLLKCLRFDKFRKWSYQTKYSDDANDDDDPASDATAFPTWFFPPRFSREAKSLIAQLLYPDPGMRLAVDEAQRHPWVLDQRLPRSTASPNALDERPAANSPQSPPSTPSSSYKHRSSVVVNVPQSTIDQEHRWSGLATARSGLTSPHSFSRPLGVSLCPPSPQKNPRLLSIASGGYMPSVDEESSLASSPTPPTSPRSCDPIVTEKTQSLNVREAEDAASLLQFELDDDESECDVDTVVESRTDVSVASAQRTSMVFVNDNTLSSELSSSVGSGPTFSSNSREATSRRFISPPLALEAAHGPMFHRSNVHRRNSPPELYLTRFEKSARLEELRPFNLELLDLNCTTPTGESTGALTLSPLDEPLPPTAEHVARSTHFTTALPAQLVLAKIETILAANPSPLPYPYKNVPQRVTVDWSHYLLDVRYGSVLTCTVQVFLYHRGVYLVEFRRGQVGCVDAWWFLGCGTHIGGFSQVEIFQFKRFYEDIREKISASMTGDRCDKELARPSTSRSSRKRNKSVSTGSAYY